MDSRQANTVNVIDYSKFDIEFRVVQKGLIKDQLRYAYVNDKSFVVCKEAYDEYPEVWVQLTPSTRIKWIFHSHQNVSFEQKVIGFRLLNQQEELIPSTELFGEPTVMVKLRDYMSKVIFECDFMYEFEIRQRIGQGKYAKVYEVLNCWDQHKYAVQYLFKQKLTNIQDSQIALFNELKILRKIDHQNCLQFHRAYQDDHGYYLLTELLNGSRTLQHEIKTLQSGISYSQVKSIMRQILEGIQYCHSIGIMHRDLKPQNIGTTMNAPKKNAVLQIIDFGLAQVINDKKFIYVHVGTPGYVAPQILSNESDQFTYSEKCDIFSIGVIFHYLYLNFEILTKKQKIFLFFFILTMIFLCIFWTFKNLLTAMNSLKIFRVTGQPLFPGQSFQQVFKANKTCKFNLNEEIYQEIDSKIMDLMKKMLERNPRKRISASDALKDIFFTYEETVKEEEVDIANCPVSPFINFYQKRISHDSYDNNQYFEAQISANKHIQFLNKIIKVEIKSFQPMAEIATLKYQQEYLQYFYTFTQHFLEFFLQLETGYDIGNIYSPNIESRLASPLAVSPKRGSYIKFTISKHSQKQMEDEVLGNDQENFPYEDEQRDSQGIRQQIKIEISETKPTQMIQNIQAAFDQNISQSIGVNHIKYIGNKDANDKDLKEMISKSIPITLNNQIIFKNEAKNLNLKQKEYRFSEDLQTDEIQNLPQQDSYSLKDEVLKPSDLKTQSKLDTSQNQQTNLKFPEKILQYVDYSPTGSPQDHLNTNSTCQTNRNINQINLDFFKYGKSILVNIDFLRTYLPESFFQAFQDTHSAVLARNQIILHYMVCFLIFGPMDDHLYLEQQNFIDFQLMLFQGEKKFDSYFISLLKQVCMQKHDQTPKLADLFNYLQIINSSQKQIANI